MPQIKERFIWIAISALCFASGYFLQSGHTSTKKTELKEESRTARDTALLPESDIQSATTFANNNLSYPNPYKSRLNTILAGIDNTDRLLELGELLQNLDESNWKDAYHAFVDQTEIHGRRHPNEFFLFVRRAGEVVGREAVEFFIEKGTPNAPRVCLESWATTDPDAAFAWLEQSKPSDTLLRAAIQGVAKSEPALALSLIDSIPADQRQQFTQGLINTFIQSIGIKETGQLIFEISRSADTSEPAEIEYLSKLYSDLEKRTLINAISIGNWEEASVVIKTHIEQPYFKGEEIGRYLIQYANSQPEAALNWLGKTFAGKASGNIPPALGYYGIIDKWHDQAGPEPLGEWIKSNKDHPHYDRIIEAVAIESAKDPRNWNATRESVLELLQTVSNPQQRAQIYNALVQQPGGKLLITGESSVP